MAMNIIYVTQKNMFDLQQGKCKGFLLFYLLKLLTRAQSFLNEFRNITFMCRIAIYEAIESHIMYTVVI